MTFTQNEKSNLITLLLDEEITNVKLALGIIEKQTSVVKDLAIPLAMVKVFYYFEEEVGERSQQLLNLLEDNGKQYLKPLDLYYNRYAREYDNKVKEEKWNLYLKYEHYYKDYFKNYSYYQEEFGSIYLYIDKENVELYIQIFEKILEYDAEHGEGCFDLAFLLSKGIDQGNYLDYKDYVFKYYLQAAKYSNYPTSDVSYRNLALAYKRILNDNKNAEKYNRKALEINPNMVDALVSLANVIDENNVEEREQLYKKAIELREFDPISYHNLADLYWFQCQDYEKAKAHFTESIKQRRTYYNLTLAADIYWMTKKKEVPYILALIKEALKLRPNYSEALVVYCKVHIELKEKLDVVERHLKHVLAEDPEHEEALICQSKLESLNQ